MSGTLRIETSALVAQFGRVLRALSRASSKDKSRSHMNAVWLDWDGKAANLVASNGFIMAVYDATSLLSAKDAAPVTIPVSLAMVDRLHRECIVSSFVTMTPGERRFEFDDATIRVREHKGSPIYPWRQTLATTIRPIAEISMSADLLRDVFSIFREAAKAHRSKGQRRPPTGTGVTLRFGGGVLDPGHFKSEVCPLDIVVMPMRGRAQDAEPVKAAS